MPTFLQTGGARSSLLAVLAAAAFTSCSTEGEDAAAAGAGEDAASVAGEHGSEGPVEPASVMGIAHVRYQIVTETWESVGPVAEIIETPNLHEIKYGSGDGKLLRRVFPDRAFGKSPGDGKWLMSRSYFRQVAPEGVRFSDLEVKLIEGPKSHHEIDAEIRPVGRRPPEPAREIRVEIRHWTRTQKFLITALRKEQEVTRRHFERVVEFDDPVFAFDVPADAVFGELVVAQGKQVHKVGLGQSKPGVVEFVASENVEGVRRYTYRLL